jgi:hypothetical protein
MMTFSRFFSGSFPVPSLQLEGRGQDSRDSGAHRACHAVRAHFAGPSFHLHRPTSSSIAISYCIYTYITDMCIYIMDMYIICMHACMRVYMYVCISIMEITH